MNEQFRKMVENHLARVDVTPLKFYSYTSNNEEFDPTKYSVEDMIKRTLTLSEEYPSYTIDNDYESSSSRWRSSIDIWRHIIYYYPQVTIFDVMNGLFNIQKECGGQYCHDVQRRVFKYKLGSESNKINGEYWDNHQPGSYSINVRDEFGLYFREWEDI